MTEQLAASDPNTQSNGRQKLFEVIERLGIPPDIKARAEKVARLTTEDLIAMIAELHAVIAPDSDVNPSPQATGVRLPDGSDEIILTKPEERLGIFQQVADLLRQLSVQVKSGDEEAFLERAGNLVGLGMVLAHPYENGNGRTARTLGHLIRYGYDESEEMKAQLRLVSSNRSSEGFSVNTYLPVDREAAPAEILQAAAAPQLSLKAREVYEMSSRAEFTTPYS